MILFTPLVIGTLEVPNRIVVSPMCQYSADDGCAGDWHLAHLAQLALSGAGLVMLEATAVERRGRISHNDLGLYSDANEVALARVMGFARQVARPGTRFGIQLGHAGRKASARRPWEGQAALTLAEDGWPTVSASAIPLSPAWPIPAALDEAGIERVIAAHVQAAQRAARLGFDVVELHGAHGYLLHGFGSPIANQREDRWGGSRENRARLPVAIAAAVRAALPASMVLGARITGSDWTEGGIQLEDAVDLTARLQEAGVGYVCVSSGFIVPEVRVPTTPGVNVPFASRIRAATGIAVRAVGNITDPAQADAIVGDGHADQVALARGFLADPRWVWRAAEQLGATLDPPPQYVRAVGLRRGG